MAENESEMQDCQGWGQAAGTGRQDVSEDATTQLQDTEEEPLQMGYAPQVLQVPASTGHPAYPWRPFYPTQPMGYFPSAQHPQQMTEPTAPNQLPYFMGWQPLPTAQPPMGMRPFAPPPYMGNMPPHEGQYEPSTGQMMYMHPWSPGHRYPDPPPFMPYADREQWCGSPDRPHLRQRRRSSPKLSQNARASGGHYRAHCPSPSSLSEEDQLLSDSEGDSEGDSVQEYVASKVAGQQHTIAEESVPKPRPTYPNKLLFLNLPDNVTENHLKTFLKLVTGCTPVELRYGDEESVLATFDKQQDLQRVQKMCKDNNLDGQLLHVCKVPMSNAVLVDNLKPDTHEESVQLFFENTKRSGGGLVQRVEMVPDENKCIVFFEDYQVIDSVFSKSEHKLDGNILKLTLYHDCLGVGGGCEDLNNFPVPKSFSLRDVNQAMVQFLQQCPDFQQEFITLLSQHHAQATIVDGTITVSCTLTPAVCKARQLAHTWSADIQRVIMKCLDTVEVFEVPVLEQIWSEAKEAVSRISHDLAIIFPRPDDSVLTVVGKGSVVNKLLEDVKACVQKIEQKKQEITETHELKPHQFHLLAAKSFDKSHPDVFVQLDLQKLVIILKGNETAVKDTLLQMYQLLQEVESEKLTNVSDSIKILLQKKETKSFIMQELNKKKCVAVWEIDKKDVIIYAFNKPDAEQAAKIVKVSVVEDVYKLSKESSRLLHTSLWQEFEQHLMNNYAGILIINCNTNSQMVNLTGKCDILPGVKQDIDDFMKNRTILTQVVSYQPNRQKFIVTVWSSRLQSICEKLKEEVVQITPINANTELELKGTSRGLAEAREELENLGKQICMHKETYTMPAMLKFFRHSDCSEDLELIGSSNKCVLALQSEPHGLHVKSTGYRTSANGSQQNPQIHINTKTTAAKLVLRLSTALKSCGQRIGALGPSLTSGAKAKPSGIIKTSVVEGEIALQMADVIVNTTDSGLDLSVGAVSSSILAKAGQALQHECRTKYPGGVMVGDVACTQGHGLQCQAVYHVTLPHWSANSKQNLSEVVTKCLTEASNTGYTSLVFPALGTGNLQYPRDESARTMLEAIDRFQRANPSTSVKDVRIVVYQKDIQTVQIFRQVHKQQAAALGPTLSSSAVASPPGVINTCVVEGDIALENADVIVNTTTTSMDFRSCPVSSSILAKAGQALQDECQAKNPGGLKVGLITCTKGHRLHCKVVYHLTLPRWSSANSKQNLSKVVTKCLTKASKAGYTSLVFPALGTGKLVYPRDVSARIMLEAIDEFQRANLWTSVRDVRIVIYQDRQTFQEFQRVHSAYGMHRQPTVHLQQLTGNRPARRFSKRTQYTLAPLAGIGPAAQESGTSTPLLASPLPPSTDLFVYAESQQSIPPMLKALQDFVLKKFVEVIWEQIELEDMEPSVIKRICDAGQRHDVEVQQADGKIRLHGHNLAVMQVQNDIKDIISAAVRQRQKEEAEEMIARMVRWSYMEVTITGRTCIEYEKPQNKIIEEAFQKKKKDVRLVDDSGNVYIINFDSMREYLENEQDDFVYVIRRDKTGLDITRSELPITWLSHTAVENLQIVSLKPSDAEYMQVEQNFRRTLNADLSALPTPNIRRIDATIVAIDRIQNQLLMKCYLAKKAHMDQHNPSGTQNERTLWHGTRSAATASINQDGFNRSYCGQNATAFGEGVYFAVNSSYSAQCTFSPADKHSGCSYMYQCKVLTGRTTKGYHAMRVLPKTSAGQTAYDSATDDVRKPSMYVIFSDTQAYPEYLITFKRHRSLLGQ